jgi:hypothetical protein
VDELPVLNLGRLPSASAAQAAQVVGKLVGYEQSGGSGSSRALFVADNNEPVFQNLCDSLAAMVPSSMTAQKVYLGSYTDFTLASSDIVSAFNRGLQLSVYSGHGDVADWAGEQILDTAKVPLLTNAAQPAFSLILNCLNGYFAMAGSYGLAETLVANPTGGSIGVFASSGLGYTWEQTLLGNRFMPLFFGADRPTLGEICTRAKVLAYQDGSTLDQLRTFTLIGDPAMRLKPAP